jgi:hypothetical protein
LERFQRSRHMPALFRQKITVLGQRRPGVCIDTGIDSLFCATVPAMASLCSKGAMSPLDLNRIFSFLVEPEVRANKMNTIRSRNALSEFVGAGLGVITMVVRRWSVWCTLALSCLGGSQALEAGNSALGPVLGSVLAASQQSRSLDSRMATYRGEDGVIHFALIAHGDSC